MSNYKISDELFNQIKNVVIETGFEFYYVEYVREENENYLRVYIDSEEGITFDNCAAVSKSVGVLLDETDPISDAYYLEVSSPGVERTLFNDKHLELNIGKEVKIKLSKIFNGSKKFEGELLSFDEINICIKSKGAKISIPRQNIKKVTLKIEF
ncbi:ribosome maturation factor RimP [Clostridium grantii]|uniref:Ribosome maturation factor RimP n=1 Tax=Clostridium grantii DSM 8605 TaxID=1121316 RepID=A0A1M5QWE5_9CLOT|nr:ribosome maturation factor RimP [Clostridium grantii]SHH18455.1 ribosome maturation factor RimP [Clostridium grantii DSM 8605]